MVNHLQPTASPSHKAVLEGLKRTCYRQVQRYRHDPLLDVLERMTLVAWVRQPLRLSQLPLSARAPRVPAPVEIAELTDAGRAALERLSSLEQSDQWLAIRATPYALQYPSTVT